MLYGEVFAGEIDPPCGVEGHPPCITGTKTKNYQFSNFLVLYTHIYMYIFMSIWYAVCAYA